MNAENLNDRIHLDRQLDQDVDRVLRGFAQATPPAHMEQRVLARLEQREPSTTPARPTRLRSSPLLHPRWAFATALLILGLATFALIARSHHPPQSIATITPTAPHPAVIADNTAVALPPPNGALGSTRAIQHHEHPKTVPTPATDASLPLAPATCHCDPIAMAEASTPSHPAPPVPLTREERHMLMLVGSGEPQQLAVLDPNLRDLEFQRARTDFNRFFETPQTEPISPTNSTKPGNDQP